MKRLLVAIVIGLILVSFATPVFAQDPPDTQVTVGVVTPGNVDLNVGIDAGGNVSVTVDGVDLQETAGLARSAYDKSHEPTNFLWDFSYYWSLSGIGPRINAQIAELQQLIDLLANSQVKLIVANDQSGQTATTLASRVKALTRELEASTSDLQTGMAKLQEQDAVTWNQLMYGAEAHLAILDDQLTEQAQRMDDQGQRVNSLEASLEVANTNNANLVNYTDYLQRQYLYYFWICGSGMVLLFGIALVALFRKRG